ncbi:MAG TPA: ATP-binding protein, partial [bacterium]
VTLDITAEKEMEEALRRSLSERAASEERLRAIISSIPGAVYQIRYRPDGTSTYTFLSEGVRDLIGYSAAEALADQSLIHNSRIPDDEPERLRASDASKINMSLRVREFRGRHRDGSLRWFHSRSMPHLDSSGDIVWDGVTTDVTDRKRLEEEVRRSEHMLALGGLVDGVAHNFNNLLQIVSGAAELLLDSLRGHPDRPVADQILSATHRGSRLVNELRRFSLRQPASTEKVDVNALLVDMRDLASHFVGAKVTLELDAEQDLWTVAVNPTRLQSVVLSLVLNARDAMPDGGTVRLETRNVDLDDNEARMIDRAAGPYVRIHVADTGVGMSPEVLKRATEPFFTTKPANQAGMGLSTVLAFVSQLGGRLSIESEQGVGTNVSLLLPAQRVGENPAGAPGEAHPPQRGANS